MRGADIAAGRFVHHGGWLCVARTLFPDVPQPWIDLSTGINPSSYPAPRASARERNRLPEPTGGWRSLKPWPRRRSVSTIRREWSRPAGRRARFDCVLYL